MADDKHMFEAIARTVPDILVTRFNETLLDFVEQLHIVFPSAAVSLTAVSNELMMAKMFGQDRLPIMTMANIVNTPIGEGKQLKWLIANKDERFIYEYADKFRFLSTLNIRDHWEKTSEPVRENIWLYLIELTGIAESFCRSNSHDEVQKNLQRIQKMVDEVVSADNSTNITPEQALAQYFAKLQ